MEITLRREDERDHRRVEEITREAFWNLHGPGCDEHYLAHVMRAHVDFITDLDFVAVRDEAVVGNIMYTRSWLENERQERLAILTFGPVSVLPDFQRQGIGSRLIEHTAGLARARGEKAIVIFGNPSNYCRLGFKGSKKYNVSIHNGRFPYALLVLELHAEALTGHRWRYQESSVYAVNSAEAELFDAGFPPKKKESLAKHEAFSLACRAVVE